MDLKHAICQFHHGEKLKSYLIVASGLIAALESLEDDEARTAIGLCKAYLDQVRGELRTAGICGGFPATLPQIEGKMKEVIWEVHINRPDEASRILGETISLVVSGTEAATSYLIEQSLL